MNRTISNVLGGAVATTTPGSALAVTKNSYSFTKQALPAIGGGVLGMLAWKKHPWLGFFSGAALGESIYPLWKGDKRERINAGCRLGTEVGAVAVSLHFKKPVGRVLGYLCGGLAAGTLLMFVPGRGTPA